MLNVYAQVRVLAVSRINDARLHVVVRFPRNVREKHIFALTRLITWLDLFVQ